MLAGFILLFLWTWLFLQDSFIYRGHDLAGGSGFLHPWSFAAGLFVVVFVIMGAASRSLDFTFRSRGVLLFALAAMVLGSILIVGSGAILRGEAQGDAVSIIGGILVGVSTPIFYVEMVRFYLRLNLTQIITVGSIGTIIASVLYGLISLLPFGAIVGVVVLLPCGMLVVLWPASHEVRPSPNRRDNQKPLYIPWKLNATAIAQGMGFGVGRWLLARVNEEGWLSGSDNLMFLIGYSFAALVLVCFATLMRRKFDTLIYKIGFPLLAFGTILLAIPALGAWGCFTMAVGYRFIDLLIWALVVYLTTARNVPLNWLAGWSTACLYLGLTLGYFLVDVGVGLFDAAPLVVVSLLAFVLMLAALLITSTENDSKAWGSLRPSGVHALRPYFHDAVAVLAQSVDLTERQREVYGLLCQGRSKKEIASELFLSQETVKVHMRNVYRRFDVHSQQELRRLLEAEEVRLST